MSSSIAQFATSPAVGSCTADSYFLKNVIDSQRDRAAAQTEARATPAVRRESDSVEVSDVAVYLSKMSDTKPVRQGLVDSVRHLISQGMYDTPDQMDAAADSLIDSL